MLFFSPKELIFFLISPLKHMLWVLIRSPEASVRGFRSFSLSKGWKYSNYQCHYLRSNPGLLHDRPTLYHVAIKAGLWKSGLCDWCRGCMQMHGAVSVLVRGTVKSLKWRLVFTKDQYSAHCSLSLCLKPYHGSSTLGSRGKTSMLMTLLSSLNRLRNVSGGSWHGKKQWRRKDWE